MSQNEVPQLWKLTPNGHGYCRSGKGCVTLRRYLVFSLFLCVRRGGEEKKGGRREEGRREKRVRGG